MRRNEIAKAYVEALPINAISLKLVIAWSDSVIEEDAEPSIDIVELSCSKNVSNAISCLNNLSIGADEETSMRILFGLCYESLRDGVANYSDVAKRLYFWYMYESDFSRFGELSSFWDAIDLANEGMHGDPEIVKKEMLEFLNENKIPKSG